MAPSLAKRLGRYQAERFPVAAYLPLCAVGTLAAVLWSRAARSAAAAIPWGEAAIGAITLLAFFFLLRVFDEHKDAAHDARHRPELPVPRGLVSLRELRRTGAAAVAFVVVVNAWLDPALLIPMAAVLAWSALMAREFFVPDWLRARPLAYLLSHMVVMPLIFLYATSLDWLAGPGTAPAGLAIFLVFAFLNGLIIEIGRKLRAPDEERPGVDTYSAAWGPGVAAATWIGAVLLAGLTGWLAVAGATAVTDGETTVFWTAAALTVLAIATAVPPFSLARRPRAGVAKRIELASGLWVLASYAVVAAASYRAMAA